MKIVSILKTLSTPCPFSFHYPLLLTPHLHASPSLLQLSTPPPLSVYLPIPFHLPSPSLSSQFSLSLPFFPPFYFTYRPTSNLALPINSPTFLTHTSFLSSHFPLSSLPSLLSSSSRLHHPFLLFRPFLLPPPSHLPFLFPTGDGAQLAAGPSLHHPFPRQLPDGPAWPVLAPAGGQVWAGGLLKTF